MTQRGLRFYLRIYGKIPAIYGTMPDIMIPFSTSHKDTVILMQNDCLISLTEQENIISLFAHFPCCSIGYF